jgi:hypothetical protein
MDSTYTPLPDTIDGDAVLKHLNAALARLTYISAWADLDTAERDSLSGAMKDIRDAIQELRK